MNARTAGVIGGLVGLIVTAAGWFGLIGVSLAGRAVADPGGGPWSGMGVIGDVGVAALATPFVLIFGTVAGSMIGRTAFRVRHG